jgi:hypothetical protein
MTPPCVVPTFRPYTVENLEFGGFYASSCESRASEADLAMADPRLSERSRADLSDNAAHQLPHVWDHYFWDALTAARRAATQSASLLSSRRT